MAKGNLPLLISAATLLRPLLHELVFVGGCSTGILVTDAAAAAVRVTYDVDAIVEVGSRAEYYEFSDRLRALGFSEDATEEPPIICRWVQGKIKLDVMPTDERILGFSNLWFKSAMDNAEEIELEGGLMIRMVTAPYFAATKLDAFKRRGKNDFLESRDLEDLITVIDGRPSFLEELRNAPDALQKFVAAEIGELLRDTRFEDAAAGHVGYEAGAQQRVGKLMQTLHAIASLSPEPRHGQRSVATGTATISAASGDFAGQLVDLSEGGAQLLGYFPLSLNESLEMRFTPEGFLKQVRVKGKVARLRPDRVAIQFIKQSSWRRNWQEIEAFYSPEVRQDERYTADASASVYIAPNRARGHVEDVSRSGMQIRSDIAANVGNAAEVRFTPQGQAEEITAAGRVARVRGNRIGIAFPETSSWQSSWRKMVAFRTVSQKKQEGPLTPELLLSKVAEIQRAAAASNEISEKTAALWKMESLGVTFGRIVQPGESLNDPRLPVEARPIVHVGMGGAAVEAADFDATEIKRIIDSVAHPEYRLFAYEQIGAMLGVYEKTVPRLMLGLKRLNRPDPARFIPLFAPEIQRLISHGYGRLLYFNSKDVQAALRNIQKRAFLDRRAAMQGAAFGYTMVNHLELKVVLETGDSLLDPELVKAFKAGLVYALEFWEWVSPGFLDSLRFDSPRANTLLEAARREIAAARVQGWLDPFLVREPL